MVHKIFPGAAQELAQSLGGFPSPKKFRTLRVSIRDSDSGACPAMVECRGTLSGTCFSSFVPLLLVLNVEQTFVFLRS